jgi:hypothetical protein
VHGLDTEKLHKAHEDAVWKVVQSKSVIMLILDSTINSEFIYRQLSIIQDNRGGRRLQITQNHG